MEKTKWAFIDYPDEWSEKVPGFYTNTEENVPEECCYVVKSNQGLCHNFFRAKNDDGADTSFFVNVFDSTDFIWAHHLQLLLDESPVVTLGHELSDFDGISFDVQSEILKAENPISAVYEWVKENKKSDNFSKKGKSVLMIVSGNMSLLDFTDLLEKIEGSEDPEIDAALYEEDSSDSEVQISLWWFDPIEKIKGLSEKWLSYCEAKKAYREKHKPVDMDDFTELVNHTWHYLSSNRITAELAMKNKKADAAEMKRLLREEFAIIQLAENIATYAFDDADDYKENPLYSVTLFLADELARLAAGKEFGIPRYDYKGDFRGLSGTSMDLALLSTKSDNHQRIYYDVDNMDYQGILKAVGGIKK